jgi:hypothetical protein
LPSRVSYGTRDPFIEAGHDVISQLRPWKATIAAWLAVVALVAAPSVVRAHGPSAPRASDLSAVVAAPAVHVSAPRRVEIDYRAPRHTISIHPAALPAGRVVAVEPRLRHDDARQPVVAAQRFHVARLADGVARVPLRLDIDALVDAIRRRVPEVVGRQVAPADRPIVAVAERNGRLVAQPRVVVRTRVPEMLVRVDDRERQRRQVIAATAS